MREQGASRVSWQLVEVTGPSMVPTLLHGDWLLVQKISSGAEQVRAGDVVVLRHPLQQDLLIVKRAVERREGGWWVLGDNTFVENDSREFGTVPDELVLARARGRFRPPRGLQRSVAGRSWRPGRRPASAAAARPLALQALAGPVGRHVRAGRAAVGAVAAGAVGRGVEVGVAAGRGLAEAEPVRAQRGELEGQAHAGDRRVAGGGVRRVVGQVHVPVGAAGGVVQVVVARRSAG